MKKLLILEKEKYRIQFEAAKSEQDILLEKVYNDNNKLESDNSKSYYFDFFLTEHRAEKSGTRASKPARRDRCVEASQRPS